MPYERFLLKIYGLDISCNFIQRWIYRDMRRQNKEKIKITGLALLEVLATGAFLTTAGLLSQGRGADRLLKSFAKYGAWRIRQLLRQLRFQNCIVYDEEDERAPIHLTEKGFIRVTKSKLRRIDGKKWDHLWRLIIFDIPDRKKSRRRFQQLLRRIGCFRVQRSVYAYPFECKDDILRLAAQYRSSSCVLVYTVPNLGPCERHARNFYFRRAKL